MDSSPLAVLDIGSNTSILLITKLNKRAPYKPQILEDIIFYTGLGEGLKFSKKAYLSPLALKRQEACFSEAKRKINFYQARVLKAVGTQSTRMAKNTHELQALGLKYGFHVEVISGEKEAKLSRWGALLPFNREWQKKTLVLDIGGSSTELSTVFNHLSLALGSINLTEVFFTEDPPKNIEIKKAEKYINQIFQKNLSKKLKNIPPYLVACAGTAFTLVALENQTQKNLNKKTMSIHQVRKWKKTLFSLTKNQRTKLKAMPYYRANILPAGVLLLEQSMRFLEKEEFSLSNFGLRHALLYSKYSKII